ncbi:ABC transporter substrate-binding protein [Gammaproteobacteria bacterium]|nr:ABC transporter substrate-binding protein [Gammaproteobacteria bacterium]
MNKWLIVLFLGFVQASDVSCVAPVKLVEEMATDLRERLVSVCEGGSEQTVEGIIREVMMPNVDVEFIVKQVLGRKYWYDATKEQQEKIESLMERLILSQYAVAFNCRQLKADVTFYPLREEAEKYVRVESTMSYSKDETLNIKYALRCYESDWKMYDFIVNGLSLGQTYRSQFGKILKSGGPQGLIDFLDKELGDV